MHRNATRFGLIVTVAALGAANIVAQQAPSDASPHLQPNAGDEEAAVKRVVDGIMQPYLAQGQLTPVAARGADLLIWERSSQFHCTAIATSSHMERLPTRALRSRAKPWSRSAPAPRLSPPRCSRWRSTATRSFLTLPLKNTCPTATRSGRSS